jgi:hypothetical protein
MMYDEKISPDVSHAHVGAGFKPAPMMYDEKISPNVSHVSPLSHAGEWAYAIRPYGNNPARRMGGFQTRPYTAAIRIKFVIIRM